MTENLNITYIGRLDGRTIWYTHFASWVAPSWPNWRFFNDSPLPPCRGGNLYDDWRDISLDGLQRIFLLSASPKLEHFSITLKHECDDLYQVITRRDRKIVNRILTMRQPEYFTLDIKEGWIDGLYEDCGWVCPLHEVLPRLMDAIQTNDPLYQYS